MGRGEAGMRYGGVDGVLRTVERERERERKRGRERESIVQRRGTENEEFHLLST